MDWARPQAEERPHFPVPAPNPWEQPGWYPPAPTNGTASPGDSATVAALKTGAIYAGFAAGAFLLYAALRSFMSDHPDWAVVRPFIILAVLSLPEFLLIRRVRNHKAPQSGTTMIIPGFKTPYFMFRHFREPVNGARIGTFALCALAVPFIAAAVLAMASLQPSETSGQVNLGQYATYTPTPRIRRTMTPSPVPSATAEAEATKNIVVPGGASYDVQGMAALLLGDVANDDTPGSSECDPVDDGTDQDGWYISQYCNWGFVGYLIARSDAYALDWVVNDMDDYRYVIDAYPDYQAVMWRDDDGWITVAVAVGNIVVIGSTGPDYKSQDGYDEIPGSLADHAESLAVHGIQRVLRLGGEPDEDPGYTGSW
jgi:hypothetical protein